ncbi:uncharacterized protein TNCV_2403641 [Trichonephila clavipes]|uniref:Uncharacterized protein n=1 Tax=Trichonephila clavipes TaxID=2585209 RepID=A0A8X6USK1_TRICX|nr:uncharacterized protein TNCV_2403641 [Trichonephila clavipes]
MAFGIAATITCAALDTHPSTPPFGVVPRMRKLDCSGMERSSLAKNPDSISAVMTIVVVFEDPVVNASILPMLYSNTPLPQRCDGTGAIAYNTRSPIVLIRGTTHTRQPSNMSMNYSQVLPLLQRLPGAIFQQDNAWPHTARMSQDWFRTVTLLLGLPDPHICLQWSISGIIWDGALCILRV